MKKTLFVAMLFAVVAVLAGSAALAQTATVERPDGFRVLMPSETEELAGVEEPVPVFGETDAPVSAKASLISLGAFTSAVDVTADGEVVVGGFLFGNCFKWTAAGGIEVLDGFEECRISSDGSVITGALFGFYNGRTRETWGISDAGYNWRALDPPADWTGCDASIANMYDVSGDGKVVVGLGWPTCQARGYEWTEATGYVKLDDSLLDPTGVQQTRADAASEDGSVIAGWQTSAFGTRQGAKWVNGVAEWILTEDGENVGEANAISRWGDYVGGAGLFEFNDAKAYVQQPDGSLIWLGDNLKNLGRPPEPRRQFVTAISPDGDTVLGFSQDQQTGARSAWIWRGGATKKLQNVLWSAGAKEARTEWQSLDVPRAVSDDGKTIVGFGVAADGSLAGFVATLP